MSIEIHVFFRGKLPTKPALAKAMKDLGFPITIPPPKDSLEKQSGFLPMRLNREEAGAEFDVFEGRANIADIMGDSASEVDPDFDRCGSFRFGGNENEMVTAICASAALAKLVGGVVLEAESGELMQVDAAIAWAKQHLDSVKPKDRKPSTSVAQVRRALKPLLDRHEDLALVGRWLILKPVHHVVCGVLIDRTSSADLFEPRWAVMHLCEVRKSIFLNWGNPSMPPQLFRPHKLRTDRRQERGWVWTDPYVIEDLREIIERVALPKLRSLRTIADLMGHLAASRPSDDDDDDDDDDKPLTGWWESQLVLDVALGNLASAHKSCVERVPKLKGETYWSGDAEDHATVARLKELSARYQAGDHKGLAALLHEWEEITVKNLKIEHLWERTPFPLEIDENKSGEDTA